MVERFRMKSCPERPNDSRPHWARPQPGVYTRLRRESDTYMTDLPEEWWHHRTAVCEASRRGGHALVSGLGLGLVVNWMLGAPESAVEHVTVLESERDVIGLVAAHLQARHGNRVKIVQADAFRWSPPEPAHYSVVWHDIWPNPYAPGILPEMDRLESNFSRHCDWQACWARETAVSHHHRPD